VQGDQDAPVEHRARLPVTLLGSQLANHRPQHDGRQLALVTGPVLVAGLHRAEVKGDHARATGHRTAATVLGTQRLPGGVAQAAIQTPVALLVANLPEVGPLDIDGQQCLLKGVVHRHPAATTLGLPT
jgi:hypothetical protein